jgi:hypothetical protein
MDVRAEPVIRISIRPQGSDAALQETARQAEVAVRVAQGLQRFQLAHVFDVIRTVVLAESDHSSAVVRSLGHVAITADAQDRDDAILITDALARPSGASAETADVWRQIRAGLKAERLSAQRGEGDR